VARRGHGLTLSFLQPYLRQTQGCPCATNGLFRYRPDSHHGWRAPCGLVGTQSRRNRRPLDDSVLVSADAPLWDFIHTVHEQPYRLVVEQTRITGIVTWSDLLKVPVLVLAFSLMAELELAMNRRILERYTADGWVHILDRAEQKHIRGRQKALERDNLVLPTIELADLWHKAKLLRGLLATGRDFDAELTKVVKLRNDVDHVKDIVRSEAELKQFVEHLEIG
jgi:hypothetical protein